MTFRRPKPRRLPGDNPMLRAAFRKEIFLLVDMGNPSVHGNYVDWLRFRGIDPDTGAMTPAGLAFFKSLLDEDRSRKVHRRRAA